MSVTAPGQNRPVTPALTGKTTAAAALALALATDGRRTLLVEVEGRQGIAQVFDTAPLPYEERKIAVAPGGGEVRALAVDPEAALLEYLEMFYRLGVAGRTLRRMGAIEFATTLAPGLRDVLLTGKAKECVARTGKDGRPVYDAVVVDAPPTGRVVSFLDVTRAMSDLARTGPIHSQSEGVVALVHSPRTVVHLVTLLEDLPVTETLETIAELEAADLRPGAVIVNRTRPQWLPDRSVAPAADGRVDAGRIRTGLATAGVDLAPAVLEGLVRRARRAGGGGGRGDEPAARGPRPAAGAAEPRRRRGPRHALRAGRRPGGAGCGRVRGGARVSELASEPLAPPLGEFSTERSEGVG